ncbi:hypothetical protein D3C76_412600 [compost metagenome]
MLRGQLAAFDAAVVLLANLREPPVQRFALEFQQGDRDAGIGEVHGDAAAHGPRADHGNTLHRAKCDVFADARYLQGFALGEKLVAQGR